MTPNDIVIFVTFFFSARAYLDGLNPCSGDVGDVQQPADSSAIKPNKCAELLNTAHLSPHEGAKVDGFELSILISSVH